MNGKGNGRGMAARLIEALDGPERKLLEFMTRITRITVTGLALGETAV